MSRPPSSTHSDLTLRTRPDRRNSLTISYDDLRFDVSKYSVTPACICILLTADEHYDVLCLAFVKSCITRVSYVPPGL